ncbi:LytR/AlgR family two component response regulator [Swaminathania salitolerans LMG 21291]|uniref:LytR family transcriptional regulator n=2 Tax=Swaminathania salitolerans TaxID=182838 RepID=A0A511BSD1_9PROT|nr:LytR/AlgR family two component response regulator [Swaminathania salitolerans LMG 21291]GEL03195.1 LytR family transcriptional regulator [Swaminathania salitolerans]
MEPSGIGSDPEYPDRAGRISARDGFVLRSDMFLRGLLLSTGGGLFLGILGPYGSYQNPGTLERVAYWVASIMVGLGLYAGPLLLLRRVYSGRTGLPYWSGVVAGTAFLSLFQTLITRGLALSIWPRIALHLPGWWTWYAQVLAIALPCVLVVMLRQQSGRKDTNPGSDRIGHGTDPRLPVRRIVRSDPSTLPEATPEATPEASRSAGVGYAAAHPGAAYPPPERIDALQMEDHYIRCHLIAGSRLVHGVFRDALARQSGCDGLQVHRSWWVARRAVSRWDGTPRSLRLHLRNGLTVPVARAQVARLREAGWLEAERGDEGVSDVESACERTGSRIQGSAAERAG